MNAVQEAIITDVLNLREYSPNFHVNKVMGALVDGVIRGDTDITTLDAPVVNGVRTVSAHAEAEMESYWAHNIMVAENPSAALEAFPYKANYTELISRELQLVNDSGLSLSDSHKVLVIGSGPLPLSAYEIVRQTGAMVDQVDSSAAAVQLGRGVSDRLGFKSNYTHADGQSVVLDGQYDLILVAALAGDNTLTKQAIIDNVLPNLSESGRIIVRSAQGERVLLYPTIAPDELTGVTLLAEYHPDDHIINSVLVYGK